MTREEFLEKFQDLLQRDESLTEDMNLSDIEEWDSLAQITTIVFFDKDFGIKINFEEIQNMRKISDLMEKTGI